jgi:hypothetical protein
MTEILFTRAAIAKTVEKLLEDELEKRFLYIFEPEELVLLDILARRSAHELAGINGASGWCGPGNSP